MVEEAARPQEASPPAVAAAQPGEARDPLFSKLAALTLFRLAIVTVLLGGTARRRRASHERLLEQPWPLVPPQPT